MLGKVVLSTDVTLACTQHALSTEKEEIMGLLIGEVHNGGALVSILSSVILRRLDKKPDRVEISEEQLVQATMRAEELASEVGRPLRVVGWYHSHPHITVWPSHVDLATQSMYQRMDSSFVGIIFAVYLTEQSTKAPSVQITCFQSVNEGSNQSRREIHMEIVNNNDQLTAKNFGILTQLPTILKEEEDEAYDTEVGNSDSGDIIVRQHNAAVRTIAIGHIVEKTFLMVNILLTIILITGKFFGGFTIFYIIFMLVSTLHITAPATLKLIIKIQQIAESDSEIDSLVPEITDRDLHVLSVEPDDNIDERQSLDYWKPEDELPGEEISDGSDSSSLASNLSLEKLPSMDKGEGTSDSSDDEYIPLVQQKEQLQSTLEVQTSGTWSRSAINTLYNLTGAVANMVYKTDSQKGQDTRGDLSDGFEIIDRN